MTFSFISLEDMESKYSLSVLPNQEMVSLPKTGLHGPKMGSGDMGEGFIFTLLQGL